jgi:hypothetical protein
MKIRSLLTTVALGAIAVFGIAASAQARVDLYIDNGDYWSRHNRDYCYYHDCGDTWYARHHRHRWHERDWWMTGGHRGGDWGDHGWRGRDHHDGDWRDHDHHDHDGGNNNDNDNNNNNNNDDDGGHHHHHG